jgi:hypothetical protein
MTKLLSLTFSLVLAATTLFAQDEPKKAPVSPHDTVKGNNMTITYGRPYKKGRVIFGDGKTSLETYGKVWRTGANEATEITVTKPCTFGSKHLEPGTYTLFTIPNEKEWTVILNSELKQWGAYGYEKAKKKDVLKTVVPAKHMNNVVEQLTIAILEKGVSIEWDNTGIFIPVKF